MLESRSESYAPARHYPDSLPHPPSTREKLTPGSFPHRFSGTSEWNLLRSNGRFLPHTPSGSEGACARVWSTFWKLFARLCSTALCPRSLPTHTLQMGSRGRLLGGTRGSPLLEPFFLQSPKAAGLAGHSPVVVPGGRGASRGPLAVSAGPVCARATRRGPEPRGSRGARKQRGNTR